MDIYWDGEDRWYAAEVRRRKRLPEAGADRWQPGGALVHEVYYPEDGEFHWHDLAQNNPDGNRWRPRGWRPVEPGNVWAASGGGAAAGGTASEEPADPLP